MGIHHSPNTITDGLLLYLDAGNSRSYNGSSGNNWIDLSGNAFSGNFTSNTSYDSANANSIRFDGTTNSVFNVANTNYPSVWSNSVTIEIWINIPSSATWSDGLVRSPLIIRGSLQDCMGISRTTTNNQVSFFTRDASTEKEATATITRDTWNQIVGIWNQQVASIAVNGKIISSATIASFGGTPESNIWKIGGNDAFASNSSTVGLSGRVSSVKIYNRGLTENEIRQNFNAIRSRYGV